MNFIKKIFGNNQKKIDGPSPEDIAIIGIACRFPGATDYNQFWYNLENGMNHISEITKDRWDVSKHYSPDRDAPNKSISKWGGLLNQIDSFDTFFFHISPTEAQSMDPQQRLLLEETWHCLEDSGVKLKELQKHNTSVYVGVMATDYHQNFIDTQTDGFACLGNYQGILANRLSYFLNLTGESLTIDNACASSLTAIHHARRSLLNGDSDYSIAAGVNVICHPWKYISFSKAHMLSPDGQCKTFAADADGYVPGEGVAVLLLEPLQKAIQNGHHIYGILKGSAVHHSGKTKTITTPRVEAQQQVVAEALATSKISPETITYIEAHGTGTSLGDPIEVEALTRAFNTQNTQYCYIGSVKTNIGHLEAAAGIAGIIKVLLMFQHQKIPKTLNIKTINPIIDFNKSPFRLADNLHAWKLPATISTRRAGISSFGFGGIEAHAILEEYIPPQKAYKKSNLPLPFLLSAKTATSLEELLKKWLSYTKTENFARQNIEDICYTLTQREFFNYRIGGVVKDKRDIIKLLEELDKNKPDLIDSSKDLKKHSVILRLHPLTMSAYANFCEVCQQYPLLAKLKIQCEDSIRRLNHGNKLLKEINNDNNSKYQLFRSFISLFIISKALLTSGLNPKILMGEGIGEIDEIVNSGMLDFNVIIQWLAGNCSEIQLKRPNVGLYDINNKKVIEPHQLSEDYFKTLLDELDINAETKNNFLEKSRELHLHQFTFKKYLAEWDEIFKKYNVSINKFLEQQPNVTGNISNKTDLLCIVALLICWKKLNQTWDLAEKVNIDNINISELVDLALDKVLTEDDIAALLLDPGNNTLTAIATQLREHEYVLDPKKPYILLKKYNQSLPEIMDAKDWLECIMKQDSFPVEAPNSVKHPLYVDIGDYTTNPGNAYLNLADLSNALPAFLIDLWEKGIPIDWSRWFPLHNCQTVALPVYVFDSKRYWITKNESMTPHPGYSFTVPSETMEPKTYTKKLIATEFYLADHKVNNIPTLPGVMYLEMVCAAQKSHHKELPAIQMSNVVWTQPIQIREQSTLVNINISPAEKGESFEITTEQGKIINASGKIMSSIAEENPLLLDIAAIQTRCNQKQSREAIYTYFDNHGLQYGPGFQVIDNLARLKEEIIAHLILPSHLADGADQFILHPSILDGALQTVLLLLKGKQSLYLPYSFSRMDVFGSLPHKCFAHVILTTDSDVMPIFQIEITDETGRVILRIKDFAVRPLQREARKIVIQEEPASQEIQAIDPALFEMVINQLGELAGKLLNIENLKGDDDLESFGMDSVMVMTFTREINNLYSIDLMPSILFEHKTLASLTQHLIKKNHIKLKIKLD